ncbi:hypothetical protein C8J57DRAFT_1229491 [Mycena rebaudengoi]|nr:hypothetical protein C8J57DRAFT_1229491 [Mycena rebaudengoi]
MSALASRSGCSDPMMQPYLPGELSGLHRAFVIGRRHLSRRSWRFVVFVTPRFWTRFLVDSSTAPAYLSHALSLSGRLGLVVRLHLPYTPSDVVPRPHLREEDLPAVIDALRPYWIRIVSAQIVVIDGESLDSVREMLVGGRFKFPFLRSFSLRAISNGNADLAHCLTFAAIHGSVFASLGTLHLRHVRVVWPHYVVLSFLHTLVLRDMV